MKKITAVILIPFFLQNCTTGNFIAINNTSDAHIEQVDLYFEGVAVDKKYKQIGYVETVAYGSTEELLNILRNLAYQNGADAVINVKKEIEINSDEDDIDTHISFSGIAVKYVSDN